MQKLYNILSVVILLVLCFIVFRACESKENAEKLNEQNKDLLITWRDKAGLEHAKISVLEGSVSDLKKLNSSKDSTLRKLQALVDKKTNSAIVFNVSTTSKGKTKTNISHSGNHHIVFKPNNESVDTIKTNNSIFENIEPCPLPTYYTTIDEPWVEGTIIANADSTYHDIKFKNEFNIVEKRERKYFWKEKTLKLTITNLNPNTTTTDLKVWIDKKPKFRRGFVFVTGVIVGSAGTILGAQGLKAILLK